MSSSLKLFPRCTDSSFVTLGRRLLVILSFVALGAGVAATSASAQTADQSSGGHHVHYGKNGEVDVTVCSDDVAPGTAHCNAHVRTDDAAKQARPLRSGMTSPSGTLGNNGAYDPAYLQSAYNAPSSTGGAGQVVAIVDAYDNPYAERDLATYRSLFGLAPCTTSNGCFRKVNQRGGTTYPTANSGWGSEISLDVQMVSAMCPRCGILLVEADSASVLNLGLAVNEAVALGANVVSNSYGASEYSSETYDAHNYFDHPGVAVVASSGDGGYGVEFPAAAPGVTAVGGTSLTQTTNTGTRNGSETVWSGSGSGCSAYVTKPVWQTQSACTTRSVADVAAVADPNTGVWVYDSFGSGGWAVYGGTSAAAPIVGSMYALANNVKGSSQELVAYPWGAPTTALNDVTSGSNGTCSVAARCTGVVGYDGPTGLGTPNGVTAFTTPTSSGSGGGTTPPSTTPPQLSATAGNASVRATWTAPTGVSGSVSYALYRGTSSGGETLLRSGLTTLSYTDSGLTNGTTYYYKVIANASGSPSLTSNEASATPMTVPSPPNNVAAHTATTTGVNLTWNAPTSNGGSPIIGYQVSRTTSTGVVTLISVTCSTATCAYADTNTVSGAYYSYKVAAINAVGMGKYSTSSATRAR